MEEEKDLYIKLFKPIKEIPRDKIWSIWMDNINNDIYNRMEDIEEYCDAKGLDFLTALYYIYLEIKGKYIGNICISGSESQYMYLDEEQLSSVLRKGIRKYKDPHNSMIAQQEDDFKSLLELVKNNGEYSYSFAYSNGFGTLMTLEVAPISRKPVKEDERNLEKQIKIEAYKRQNNKNKYITNPTIEIIDKYNFDSLSDFENNMYIENEKAKENITTLDEKNQDKYNYKEMVEKLRPFIPGGTESVYRSVIENKELPSDEPTLRMNKPNKANIVRFADCFEITVSKINKIFDIEVKSNDRPKELVNDFYRKLKEINPLFTSNKQNNK